MGLDCAAGCFRLKPQAAEGRLLRVLNLFAYTGGSTLAAVAGGAEVVHIDAAHSSVDRARENALLSSFGDRPIRWIPEDAMKFCQREVKRGNRYDAVILDPPSYGHGPKGEVWKIGEHCCRSRIVRRADGGESGFVLVTSLAGDWSGGDPLFVGGSSDIVDSRRSRGVMERRKAGDYRVVCMRDFGRRRLTVVETSASDRQLKPPPLRVRRAFAVEADPLGRVRKCAHHFFGHLRFARFQSPDESAAGLEEGLVPSCEYNNGFGIFAAQRLQAELVAGVMARASGVARVAGDVAEQDVGRDEFAQPEEPAEFVEGDVYLAGFDHHLDFFQISARSRASRWWTNPAFAVGGARN
jgi:hypothetical protein